MVLGWKCRGWKCSSNLDENAPNQKKKEGRELKKDEVKTEKGVKKKWGVLHKKGSKKKGEGIYKGTRSSEKKEWKRRKEGRDGNEKKKGQKKGTGGVGKKGRVGGWEEGGGGGGGGAGVWKKKKGEVVKTKGGSKKKESPTRKKGTKIKEGCKKKEGLQKKWRAAKKKGGLQKKMECSKKKGGWGRVFKEQERGSNKKWQKKEAVEWRLNKDCMRENQTSKQRFERGSKKGFKKCTSCNKCRKEVNMRTYAFLTGSTRRCKSVEKMCHRLLKHKRLWESFETQFWKGWCESANTLIWA